jgi:hypothetical protein
MRADALERPPLVFCLIFEHRACCPLIGQLAPGGCPRRAQNAYGMDTRRPQGRMADHAVRHAPRRTCYSGIALISGRPSLQFFERRRARPRAHAGTARFPHTHTAPALGSRTRLPHSAPGLGSRAPGTPSLRHKRWSGSPTGRAKAAVRNRSAALSAGDTHFEFGPEFCAPVLAPECFVPEFCAWRQPALVQMLRE